MAWTLKKIWQGSALPFFIVLAILGMSSIAGATFIEYDPPDGSLNLSLWTNGTYNASATVNRFADSFTIETATAQQSQGKATAIEDTSTQEEKNDANAFIQQKLLNLFGRNFSVDIIHSTSVSMASSCSSPVTNTLSNSSLNLNHDNINETIYQEVSFINTVIPASASSIAQYLYDFYWSGDNTWSLYINNTFNKTINAEGWNNTKLQINSKGFPRSTCGGGDGTTTSIATTITNLLSFNISDAVILKTPLNNDTNNNNSFWNFKPSWVNESVKYNNCNLFIDDIFQGSNTTVLDNNVIESINFNLTTEGVHNWMVSCENELAETINSTSRTFTIDVTKPTFTFTNPTNGSVFFVTTTQLANITYNDNFDLFNCGYDIFYSNGSLLLSNSTPCSGTEFIWDTNTFQINQTGEYVFNASATDSHTKEKWNPKLWWNDNKGVYVQDDLEQPQNISGSQTLGWFDWIPFLAPPPPQKPSQPSTYKIEWLGKNNGRIGDDCEDEDSLPIIGWLFDDKEECEDTLNTIPPVIITAQKLEDRIKFSYEFYGDRDDWYQLNISAQESIQYRSQSPFAGHFVLNKNNWVDFQDLINNDFEFRVDYVGQKNALVSFKPPGSGYGLVIGDPATGGLNFGSAVVNFTVNQSVPVASFNITNPISAYFANDTLTFNDTSSDQNGFNITNWYWDLGDGTTSTNQNLTHLYSFPGVYNVSLIVTNNISVNSSRTSQNITINGFQIQAFDESSLTPLTGWTFNVFNSSTSKTFFVSSNPYIQNNFSNFPTGSITINVNNTNYISRTYFDIYNIGSPVNLSSFLLKTTDGVFPIFLTQDTTGFTVPQVLLRFFKTVSGNLTLVTEAFTDDTGTVQIFLDPLTIYTFTATKTGFTDKTVAPFQPVSTTYIIVMEKITSPQFQNTSGILYQRIEPQDKLALNSSTAVVKYICNDPFNQVTEFEMQVLLPNRSIVFSSLITNVSGCGQISTGLSTFNLPDGNYSYVTGRMLRNGINYSIERQYWMTNGTITGGYSFQLQQAPLSEPAKALLSFLIIFVIVLGLNSIAGQGASLIGAGASLYFVYIGWLSIELASIAILATLLVLASMRWS